MPTISLNVSRPSTDQDDRPSIDLNKNNCSDRFPKVFPFPKYVRWSINSGIYYHMSYFTGRDFRYDSVGSPNKFEASRTKSMGKCATYRTFPGCLSYMKETPEIK